MDKKLLIRKTLFLVLIVVVSALIFSVISSFIRLQHNNQISFLDDGYALFFRYIDIFVERKMLYVSDGFVFYHLIFSLLEAVLKYSYFIVILLALYKLVTKIKNKTLNQDLAVSTLNRASWAMMIIALVSIFINNLTLTLVKNNVDYNQIIKSGVDFGIKQSFNIDLSYFWVGLIVYGISYIVSEL